jgi:hypothetical protein
VILSISRRCLLESNLHYTNADICFFYSKVSFAVELAHRLKSYVTHLASPSYLLQIIVLFAVSRLCITFRCILSDKNQHLQGSNFFFTTTFRSNDFGKNNTFSPMTKLFVVVQYYIASPQNNKKEVTLRNLFLGGYSGNVLQKNCTTF